MLGGLAPGIGEPALAVREVALVQDAPHRERAARGEPDRREHRDRDRGAVPLDEPADPLGRGVAVRRDQLAGQEPPELARQLTGVGVAIDQQR